MTEIVNLKTAPMLYGQKYEKSALSKYEQDFERSPVNCGIYVSKSHPSIAASPDGIVNDTVVEVKCPFVAKDKMISPKTLPFLLYNDGKFMLNESHNYYYQVQGQMFWSDIQAASSGLQKKSRVPLAERINCNNGKGRQKSKLALAWSPGELK
ncbi:unnamed protein product [Mytilus coruscus]|uniref:YqaJ viral recombinase domain-containing protein n=1 Tax=Mytilus coruscus TaxID=42192 RepID=A0A6J8DST4_MYTCO|nr:unnamed protein product [Mytilus coruscus]